MKKKLKITKLNWTGAKIKELRDYIGLTQAEFSMLLKCSSRHYISTLEKIGIKNGTTKAELLDALDTVKDRIKEDKKSDRIICPLKFYLTN